MALTNAEVFTEVQTPGGPEEGFIVTAAQGAAGVITNLTGGTLLAVAFPASVNTPMKALNWLVERVWKHQELTAAQTVAVKKLADFLRNTSSSYSGGNPIKELVQQYLLEIPVPLDSINDTMIQNASDPE